MKCSSYSETRLRDSECLVLQLEGGSQQLVVYSHGSLVVKRAIQFLIFGLSLWHTLANFEFSATRRILQMSTIVLTRATVIMQRETAMCDVVLVYREIELRRAGGRCVVVPCFFVIFRKEGRI